MRIIILAGSFLLIAGLTTSAQAVSVQYDVVALGGDQYRYYYSVTNDGSLGSGTAVQLFDIFFDPATYLESSLTIATPAALSLNWDQLILASAPGVPAAYDALALGAGIADGVTVAGFAVEFSWIGQGTPGAQYFEIHDPTTFALLEQGVTTSPVPVAAAVWFFASGFGIVAALTQIKTTRWVKV